MQRQGRKRGDILGSVETMRKMVCLSPQILLEQRSTNKFVNLCLKNLLYVDKYNLLSTFYVLNAVLSNLRAFSYLNFTIILQDRYYYYSHFIYHAIRLLFSCFICIYAWLFQLVCELLTGYHFTLHVKWYFLPHDYRANVKKRPSHTVTV